MKRRDGVDRERLGALGARGERAVGAGLFGLEKVMNEVRSLFDDEGQEEPDREKPGGRAETRPARSDRCHDVSMYTRAGRISRPRGR